MTSLATFAGSSVGKKVLVAATGLVLFAHFLENLLHGWALIAFEVVLIAAFLIHAIYAITVALIDKRKARPQRYAMVRDAGGKSRKSLASRSMVLTGPIILIFVVLHVNMFKFADHPLVSYHGTQMKDLNAVVVEAFKNPWIVVGYVAVMILLGMHLWHGVWSAFQSLGWNSDRHIQTLTRLSWAAGVVLGIGFLLLPPYIYFFATVPGGH